MRQRGFVVVAACGLVAGVLLVATLGARQPEEGGLSPELAEFMRMRHEANGKSPEAAAGLAFGQAHIASMNVTQSVVTCAIPDGGAALVIRADGRPFIITADGKMHDVVKANTGVDTVFPNLLFDPMSMTIDGLSGEMYYNIERNP